MNFPSDRHFITPPVGEDVTFRFHTPAAGKVSIQTCYGPHGSGMMRTSTLHGPGVNATKVSPSARFDCVIGPQQSMHFGSVEIITAYGLQPNSDYELTVTTGDPGNRTTEMFCDLQLHR
jgi:hypothetical protein